MLKTNQSISKARRDSVLGPVAVLTLASLVAIGAGVADGSSGNPNSGAIIAAGAAFHADFNNDGLVDNRALNFHAVRHADGTVTGKVKLRITVYDFGDPLTITMRADIDDALIYGEAGNRAVLSGLVTSSDYPLDCQNGGYSVDTQIAFLVEDNGNGGEAAGDRVSSLAVWDCVPFDGADYGLPDYTGGLAHFVVEYGLAGPDCEEFFPPTPVSEGACPYVGFLEGFLTDIDHGHVSVF